MNNLLSSELDEFLDDLIKRYPELNTCVDDIVNAYLLLEKSYLAHNKLLVAGNGGSAADAEHIVGELMKSFKLPRELSSNDKSRLISVDTMHGKILSQKLQRCLPAISLAGHPALSTAYANDCDASLGFAQQIYGFGVNGDVFLAISTSGNSQNIIYAAICARAKGMSVIGLTGRTGGALSHFADICIKVPSTETYKIQEYHLPIYHCLCLMLEKRFFG